MKVLGLFLLNIALFFVIPLVFLWYLFLMLDVYIVFLIPIAAFIGAHYLLKCIRKDDNDE